MGEEVADGHPLLPRAGELGEVLLHRIVQAHPPVLHQEHHRRGGAHDLGERGQVVDGAVGVHRLGLVAPAPAPDPLLQDDALAAPHGERRAGEGAAAHLVVHGLFGADQRGGAQPRLVRAGQVVRGPHAPRDGGGGPPRGRDRGGDGVVGAGDGTPCGGVRGRRHEQHGGERHDGTAGFCGELRVGGVGEF